MKTLALVLFSLVWGAGVATATAQVALIRDANDPRSDANRRP
jgi:hypothetical protein